METNRKERKGVVVSNKMDKTVVVSVTRTLRHPLYQKVIHTRKKYYAHTDKELEIGQDVTIRETRPMSKLKRWKVVG